MSRALLITRYSPLLVYFTNVAFFIFTFLYQGGNTNSVERTDSVTSEIQSTASGMWNTMTSLTKQRVKLNMKLLGQFTGQQPNMKEDKPTYREQFVSPQMSMISYFLMKVWMFKITIERFCISACLYFAIWTNCKSTLF